MSVSRRAFVGAIGATGLGLLAGCGRLPWQAQAPARLHRIGYLDLRGTDDSSAPLLWEGLQALGYSEGQNIIAEYRYADGNPDQLYPLAAELAALNLELIVARGTIPARAASEATPRTPVVMAGGDAEVGSGLIASFARPGGNLTGVVTGTVDFAGKWLELLKIALPPLARVALLLDPLNDNTDAHLRELERAAELLQVRLQLLDVGEFEGLTMAFSAMSQEHAEALILVPGGRVSVQRSRIAALALANRLPAMAEWREFALAGGLMSYGTSGAGLVRRAATFVDKILKGAKPADLPIERPMTFDFLVNLKTAQTLGITFPNEIMLQVTEVIR